jgi:hypothetical protein
MDATEWAVVLGCAGAVAFVLVYFFGPGRDGAGRG